MIEIFSSVHQWRACTRPYLLLKILHSATSFKVFYSMLLPTLHFYEINTWTYASIHVLFCLTCCAYQVLPIIKDAQGQHGLRHGDYQRYRYSKLLISYHLGCIQLAWHKLHLDFMEWPFVTLQQQQQQHKLYFHLNFGVASEPMHCIIGCY